MGRRRAHGRAHRPLELLIPHPGAGHALERLRSAATHGGRPAVDRAGCGGLAAARVTPRGPASRDRKNGLQTHTNVAAQQFEDTCRPRRNLLHPFVVQCDFESRSGCLWHATSFMRTPTSECGSTVHPRCARFAPASSTGFLTVFIRRLSKM